jgi:RNA polymerase sigma factor (sigma-70 family)
MRFNFVENTFRAIEEKLKERNFIDNIPELEGMKTLSEHFKSLQLLGLQVEGGYLSYTLLDSRDKKAVKEAAKCLTLYCASTIHARFLKLGYNNYDNTVKNYSPIVLEEKFKEQGLFILANQICKLRTSHAMIDQTKRLIGFKSQPFNINDEIVSAIFRADPIINRQAKLMLMTVYGFLYKKSIDLGRKIAVERAGVDQEDLFNSGSIGYLSAAVIWNPNWKGRMGKLGSGFVSFGWEFANRYFKSAMMSSRIVRFPSHIEELIYKVHRQIRDRRIELINQKQPLSAIAIEQQLAKEFCTEIKKVREVFAIFDSPSSALSAYLPSEQKLIRLDRTIVDSDMAPLKDSIPNREGDKVEEDIFTEQLILNIGRVVKKLPPKERIVILLRFGLPFSPRDWQDSGIKELTGKPWHQFKVQEYSLAQIGQMMDLSRERVRVIEANGLKKLRHPKRRASIRQFTPGSDYTPVSVKEDEKQSPVKSQLLSRQSILDSMDRFKFSNLTGHFEHINDVVAICKTVDSVNKTKYTSVSKVIKKVLELLFARLVEIGIIDDRKYNLASKVIETIESAKLDLSGNPSVANSIGILLFYADTLSQKNPIDSANANPYYIAINYLKDNPYFVINLV